MAQDSEQSSDAARGRIVSTDTLPGLPYYARVTTYEHGRYEVVAFGRRVVQIFVSGDQDDTIAPLFQRIETTFKLTT